jgi:hypothetical protein
LINCLHGFFAAVLQQAVKVVAALVNKPAVLTQLCREYFLERENLVKNCPG